jgi:hypothetical protein
VRGLTCEGLVALRAAEALRVQKVQEKVVALLFIEQVVNRNLSISILKAYPTGTAASKTIVYDATCSPRSQYEPVVSRRLCKS